MVELVLCAFGVEDIKILPSEVTSCDVYTNSVTSSCYAFLSSTECFIAVKLLIKPHILPRVSLLCVKDLPQVIHLFAGMARHIVSFLVALFMCFNQGRFFSSNFISIVTLRNIGSHLKRTSRKSAFQRFISEASHSWRQCNFNCKHLDIQDEPTIFISLCLNFPFSPVFSATLIMLFFLFSTLLYLNCLDDLYML